MASRKKKVEETPVVTETIAPEVEISEEIATPEIEIPAPVADEGPKYKVGSIVFLSKDANTDLNGFKLFPQYKKYTYTVEAYDGHTGVYTLRRLNLSLKLKEGSIVAPNERGKDALSRKQF